MAPLTAWLPVRPYEDVDIIIKIVGSAASELVKDWVLIAQSLIQKGLSVITQQERLNGEFVFDIRLATRPFHSMGHGCDVLVYLGHSVSDCRDFRLQPGSLLLWEPSPKKRRPPVLPDGVIAYPIPLTDLCLQSGEGLMGKGLAALGALLHLLGIPETTLCRWSPSLSAPGSFAAGHDYARYEIEKRDAYSLPLAKATSSRAMLLSPERAILLGYAVGACACRTACKAELFDSPGRWTAKHLDAAGSMMSILENESHPSVRVYRGPGGNVLAALRGNEVAVTSCLNGVKAPLVLVAADIPDVFNLILTGHDLIRNGLSDGVGVLIEDDLASRRQSVDASTLADWISPRNSFGPESDGFVQSHAQATMIDREGDTKADVGFVAWGAAQGVVRDAVALCRNMGIRVAGLYPKQIEPFPLKAMEVFAECVGRVVLVESGQRQRYWSRIRRALSFQPVVLTPEPGHSFTPMDLLLQESLGMGSWLQPTKQRSWGNDTV